MFQLCKCVIFSVVQKLKIFIYVYFFLLRNSNLWTPIDCAASGGHDQVLELLIKAEADVDPIDKSKVRRTNVLNEQSWTHPTTPTSGDSSSPGLQGRPSEGGEATAEEQGGRHHR